MITLADERQKNLAVARQINRETRLNPNSPYVGKYIGVLHQQVVAVADTLEELDRQLDAAGDTAHEAACLEASADYDRTYMIWQTATPSLAPPLTTGEGSAKARLPRVCSSAARRVNGACAPITNRLSVTVTLPSPVAKGKGQGWGLRKLSH